MPNILRSLSFREYDVMNHHSFNKNVPDLAKERKIETSDSTKLNKRFIPKKNPCGYSRLCDNTISKYPNKQIKRLLKKNREKFAHLNGSVIEPTDLKLVPSMRYSEGEYEDLNMCRTRRKTVFPKMGFDNNMKEKYIVNVGSFKQVVTYETCVDTNNECFGNGILPNDFKTFCKQTYSVVRLVSLDHSGNLEYGRFTIPSTCVCSYKRHIIGVEYR